MRKIIVLAVLCLLGCESRIARHVSADERGQVNINGKDCEIVRVNVGDAYPMMLFIDCGPGSSAVTYRQGKQQGVMGQYVPQEKSCECSQNK